jgi:hypothetical protein
VVSRGLSSTKSSFFFVGTSVPDAISFWLAHQL